MFEPIVLRGEKIGVQICHDMFFGLVGSRLRAAGATTLIDLSGGGVVLAKWTNVMRARSIEGNCRFLCTMSRRPGDRGAAVALAFEGGRVMQPVVDATREDGAGGFVVHDLGSAGEPVADASEAQAFSPHEYSDIRVGFGARAGSDVDVVLAISGGVLTATGRAQKASKHAPWLTFATRQGSLGVLLLPVESLYDPLAIHRVDAPPRAFAHHLVVYGGSRPVDHDEAVALLRLRAIEHRVAAALFTPSVREVIKTNRYKNIQRFKPLDGDSVFGLDANFINGNSEGGADGATLGIPARLMQAYRDLMPDV